MVKAALEAMRRHLVIQDKDPKVLAQLARLMKGDRMMQLTCEKNALQAKVEELDGLAYQREDCKKSDGTIGEYKKLWSEIAEEEEIDRIQELRSLREMIEQRDRRIQALEQGIKQERDQLDLALACNDKARELIRRAQTQAGRAGFAIAVYGCPQADEHVRRTYAIIIDTINVLDQA
jgi:protein subunit release factor A